MVELKTQNFKNNHELFLREKVKLEGKLGRGVSIEHVGSTAIPNMVGKNIIDILVGANDEKEFNDFKVKIGEIGFFPSSGSANNIYQFFASKEEETGEGDTHIHLVIKDTKRYKDFIVLRDYLIGNKAEAEAYAKCKLEILKNVTSDRRTYRNVKSEYVSALIEKANKALK